MVFQGARNSPRRGVHPCRQCLHAFIITYIRVSATSRLVYELFSPKKWPRAQKTDVRSGWMKLGWNTVINFLMLGHFWAGHIETAPWLWPPAWKSRPQEFVLTWKWFLAKVVVLLVAEADWAGPIPPTSSRTTTTSQLKPVTTNLVTPPRRRRVLILQQWMG